MNGDRDTPYSSAIKELVAVDQTESINEYTGQASSQLQDHVSSMKSRGKLRIVVETQMKINREPSLKLRDALIKVFEIRMEHDRAPGTRCNDKNIRLSEINMESAKASLAHIALVSVEARNYKVQARELEFAIARLKPSKSIWIRTRMEYCLNDLQKKCRKSEMELEKCFKCLDNEINKTSQNISIDVCKGRRDYQRSIEELDMSEPGFLTKLNNLAAKLNNVGPLTEGQEGEIVPLTKDGGSRVYLKKCKVLSVLPNNRYHVSLYIMK